MPRGKSSRGRGAWRSSGGVQRRRSNRVNDSQSYSGPIAISGMNNSAHPIRECGTYYAPATTSGGGVIDLVFGSSPAVLNEWTTWQTLYHEYRVLGIELLYVPIKNVVSWAYGVGIHVVDRKDSTALGSRTAACNHNSAEFSQMFQSWKRKATMEGPGDSTWLPVASPASNYYIKIYSANNATIQTIGDFYLKFLVEFRTKS